MGTPRGLELSNVQYGGVWAHRAIGVGYRMYNVMRNGTPRGLVKIGRGGACVSARVAPTRAHPSLPPVHNAYVFGMETPLRGRSGGHAGAAPTHFA